MTVAGSTVANSIQIESQAEGGWMPEYITDDFGRMKRTMEEFTSFDWMEGLLEAADYCIAHPNVSQWCDENVVDAWHDEWVRF